VERVARFTTFYDCCQPRVTNIQTIARAVNGTVVQPGETFSIDALVGPRTTAKGYVPAPYLQEGEGQCCAVGGGVSQFGTTIHNAVFWGGYDLVEYSPHTGWISRYPLGIEATLVYNSIDYKFRNDTVTPVTIRTSSTGTSVTVEIWGNQGGWQMTGFHPTGSRSSRISVLDQGGADAKRVSASVTGSAPGVVRIERRRTGQPTDLRFWRYLS
jgi:vancomycin resistance protein YoaR